MATHVLSWTPANAGNNINQRALRIAKINGSVPDITTGFTPINDLGSTINTTSYNSAQTNTIYRYKVQSLCVTAPLDNTNGIVEMITFACTSVNILDKKGDSLTLFVNAGTPNPIDGGTVIPGYSDISNITASLYDSTNTTLISGPFTVPVTGTPPGALFTFTGLTPGVAYKLRYTLKAIVNGTEILSTDNTQIGSVGCVTDLVTSLSNLEFTWNKISGESVNLSVGSTVIDGTYSQIDWGDGVSNNLLTHTYTNTGSYTVKVFDSTATNITILNKNITAITKIPSTTESLNLQSNSITNYPVFTNTNLQTINFSYNNITNTPNFSGTLNLSNISFDFNNVTGPLDFSMLTTLQVITFRGNAITSINSLVGMSSILIMNFAENQLTAMPNFLSLTNLLVIDFQMNTISGTLNLANSPNLISVSFAGNTLIAMPVFTLNTHLQSLNLSNTGISGTLNLTGLTLFQSLGLDNNTITNILGINDTILQGFSVMNNQLPVSIINNLFIKTDQANISGSLPAQSQGQTPTATPTGAGLSSKNALITRGYNVTSD